MVRRTRHAFSNCNMFSILGQVQMRRGMVSVFRGEAIRMKDTI